MFKSKITKIAKLSALTVVIAVAATLTVVQVEAKGFGRGGSNQSNQTISQKVQSYTTSTLLVENLSTNEVNALLLLREEEKVARDVYLTLGDLYHTNVFYNIAKSEQNHMDAIKTLLEKYSINDPVKDETVGSFTNKDMASLYQSLVKQGSTSYTEALVVGATIEDLDINDIDKQVEAIDNQDILGVFARLRSGSENHLRAFVNNLKVQGGEYKSQFISDEEYNNILSSESSKQQGKQTAQGSNQNQGRSRRK